MKIPKEAKLAFKGVLFDVYQWEQEQFDGSKALFERLKRRDSVAVIPITQEGKIILCEEEQPMRLKFISTPGGQTDEGEDPRKAGERELLEETGYVGDLELWNESQPFGNKIDWTVYTYIARNCKKIAEQNLDGGEKIRPFLVDFEEYTDYILSNPNFRSVEITLAFINAMRKPNGLDNLRKLLLGK